MHSLSTRLIILLISCAALIFGAGMLLDYRLSRQEILQRLTTESANEVRSVVADLENWLSGVEGATRFLARVLERQVVEKAELRAMLRDVVSHNDEIYGATIALNPAWTASGRGFAPYYYRRDGQIHYADLTTEQADYQNQDWYRLPLESGQASWSEPYFDQGGGEVTMTTFSVPVYRQHGDGSRRAYAVVTADVRLQDLHQLLSQLHRGPNNYSILLSRGGILMSGRNPGNIMHHYSEVETSTDGRPWSALLQRALAGEDLTTDIPCPESQGRCTLRMGLLRGTGWPIAVVFDQQQVLARLQAFTRKSALISAATLLIMALAVYLITARLTRPLRALSLAAQSIGKGRLDYPLPRAQGSDEIATLVRAFSEMSRNLQQHMDKLETATASRSRLEGELAAAREIQMSLLPGGGEAVFREGRCSLWARVEPARTVGGDFYSWRHQEGHVWFAVGDVSDKGIPAALFMSRAVSLLDQLTETAASPSAALAALNALLCRDNPACMFVTLLLGRLDSHSGQLQYASAGHPAPSLRHGQYVNSLAPIGGPPLGLAPGQHFPGNRLVLEPGDCLAVFTDGVEEEFDGRGEMFGVERFNASLAETGQLPIREAGQHLFATLAAHAAGEAQSDDIAILLLRYWHASNAVFKPGDNLVKRATQWLQSQLRNWAVDDGTALEIVLLAEEILTNIDKYAGLTTEDEIAVQLVRAGNVIALETRDRGVPFNPLLDSQRAALARDAQRTEVGGLGVHLIEKFSDHQNYYRTDGHNALRVEKALPRSADTPLPRELHKAASGGNGRPTMHLTTTVTVDEELSLARVQLDGALNTDTAPDFEKRLQAVVAEKQQLIVLDMKDLDYISSAGLRVIFKAAKEIHNEGRTLAAANRKPHIDKVFEILKALPDMAVFANEQELDDYLSQMQQQVKDEG